MIIMGDKRKGPAVDAILGPDPRVAYDKEDGPDEDSHLHAITSELMDAFDKKDIAGATESLKAFHRAHAANMEDEEDANGEE